MREILGRRRRLLSWRIGRKIGRKSDQSPALLGAALTFATAWHWPVLPGVGIEGQVRQGFGTLAKSGRGDAPGPRGGAVRCACPDPECAFPGAHPLDPGLLAATTDERMVRWWWTNRPGAPVLLATGGRAPCAVSLPAVPGARALSALQEAGIRLGPVIATQARVFILVAPYSMEQLGALLYAKDWVPGSLRFHGEGGYVALPPSETGQGQVRWEQAPLPGSAAPWVPDVQAVVDAVVDALTRTGVSAPEL
ncbi:bifunctional DNA primase/polymerase [Streptomyces aureoverticillatus]|uniref:bifunctional DNA primase/polymerase n=1 Tax=Streptomyces aureoverticillatus TaxID=66871 RepID=UPI0013DA7525|nr:bifunctional DNA primase/polymerase [Streptomyces aureoverticillatus]QIB44820.1 bifunctional DNA primase/polymerase [Streptomyces aureoverticillatus]